MLVLNEDDVRRSLAMPAAIDAMRAAFSALGRDEVIQPNRTHLDIHRHSGVTLVMPAYSSDEQAEALAVKVVSVFPENVQKGQPRIQAAVLVLDPTSGEPLALLNGTAITAIRTAAVSGLATDLLARPDSRKLAIIGTGVQARSHIDAVRVVRDITEIRICGRTADRTQQFADELSQLVDVEIKSFPSADDAIRDADIVCTVTTAADAVFDDSSIASGTHINAVGAYQPHVREIPPETVVRSRVVVDQRKAALEEAGDLIQPINAGLISETHIATELATVLLDRSTGRQSAEEITLFKSVGLAVEDVYAAAKCLETAKRQNIGTRVNW